MTPTQVSVSQEEAQRLAQQYKAAHGSKLDIVRLGSEGSQAPSDAALEVRAGWRSQTRPVHARMAAFARGVRATCVFYHCHRQQCTATTNAASITIITSTIHTRLNSPCQAYVYTRVTGVHCAPFTHTQELLSA